MVVVDCIPTAVHICDRCVDGSVHHHCMVFSNRNNHITQLITIPHTSIKGTGVAPWPCGEMAQMKLPCPSDEFRRFSWWLVKSNFLRVLYIWTLISPYTSSQKSPVCSVFEIFMVCTRWDTSGHTCRQQRQTQRIADKQPQRQIDKQRERERERQTTRETNMACRPLRCWNVLSCKLLISFSVRSRWRNVSSPSNACLDTDFIWLVARTRWDNDVRPMNTGDESSSTDDNLLSFNSLYTLHISNAHIIIIIFLYYAKQQLDPKPPPLAAAASR